MFSYIRTRKFIERASLTPEGFVYLIVLCFITVGSVIRNVNLLILMAGMMYAPLFINWRLAVRRLRSFRARRVLPHRIHANKLVSFQWQCENVLAGIAAYNVQVDDQIKRAEDQGRSRDVTETISQQGNLIERWFGELINRIYRRGKDPNVSHGQVRFPKLISHQTDTQSYRVFFGQRGKYVAGGATVSTTFPFGLIVSRNWVNQNETFFVAPEIGRLEPTWEQRVQSSAVGSDSLRRTRAMEEDEFYALRPWRSGDSKKSIHWRSTARQGYPIVKQYDQQNNRDFAIVLDLYQDQDDSVSQSRIETVLSFAATAVLKIGNDVQGQVAVSVCGAEQEHCRSRTPQAMISDVMPVLAVAQGASHPKVIDAIVEAMDAVSSGTPIYVISTRPQPLSIGLMLPEAAEDANDAQDSRLSIRRAKYLARRFRAALPMIRWLDTESDLFQSIFSVGTGATGDLSKPFSELEKMAVKWGGHA